MEVTGGGEGAGTVAMGGGVGLTGGGWDSWGRVVDGTGGGAGDAATGGEANAEGGGAADS